MAAHDFEWKLPRKREFLGGDLLAQSLARLGVDVSFGLHGGHLDAFLVGCELAGIRLIDTRHEAPAVQAAEAYAKLSGKVGCCFVTANSGYARPLTTSSLGQISELMDIDACQVLQLPFRSRHGLR